MAVGRERCNLNKSLFFSCLQNNRLFVLINKILKLQNSYNLHTNSHSCHINTTCYWTSSSTITQLFVFCLQQVHKYLPRCVWSKVILSCKTTGFIWPVQTVQYIDTNHRLTLILNHTDGNILVSYSKICFLRQETPQVWSTTYRRHSVGWLDIKMMSKLTVEYFLTHRLMKRLVQPWIMEYYRSMQVTMHIRACR